MQEKIIWTALPNGITIKQAGTFLRLSVAISPRLYNATDTTLGAGWDFRHWPTILSQVSFAATFADSATSYSKTIACQRDAATPPASDTLWHYLFTGNTLVRGYSFRDLSGRFIWSYQVKNLRRIIEDNYTSLAAGANPDALPNVSALLGLFDPRMPGTRTGALDVPEDSLPVQLRTLRSNYSEAGAITPHSADPYQDFLQMRLFHFRPRNDNPPVPVPQTLDFHEAVASLMKYPALARRLGLIVDLLVPNDPTLPQNSSTATLQVTPTFGTSLSVPAVQIQPFTYFTLDVGGGVFDATSQSGEVRSGMLDVTDSSRYALEEIDIDGAALKVVGMVAGLVRAQGNPTVGTPTTAGVPALRSKGISLIRIGSALTTAQAAQNVVNTNSAAESSQPVFFHAEDLVAGYRVDVFDEVAGKWYSLCKRDGTYLFGPDPKNPTQTLTISDEGFVSLGVTQDPSGPPSGGSSPDLYQHESMLTWDGWGLAASRPFDYVGTDGSPTTYNPSPSPDLNLVTRFQVTPGTLPRLRFGRSYRMRVRTVNVAGNSLDSTTPIATFSLPAPGDPSFIYRRYEPIEHPAVILHDPLQTSGNAPFSGESTERLVVRSDVGRTTAQYVQSYLVTAPLNYPGFLVDSQRHIVPPRTSEGMAEAHSLFDVSSGTLVVDPNSRDNINGSGQGFAQLDGDLSGGASDPNSSYFTTNQLTLPYLPDPLARGAAIGGLPGVSGVQLIPFDGTWPYARPFRLQVVGVPAVQSSSTLPFDTTNRVLTVNLSQGDRLTLRLSSFLNPSDLNLLGVWNWITNAFAPNPPPPAFQTLATTGQLWMLTPFRQVEIVHAVQRPLLKPAFKILVATKTAIGQTYADIRNTKGVPNYTDLPMAVSGKSTSKLDVIANWTEKLDDPADPSGPKTIKGQDHAFEVPVAVTDTQVTFSTSSSDERRHQFHDTRHRYVKYTAVATTRFQDYFSFMETDIAAGTAPITQSSAPAAVHVPNSARPDAPQVLYVIPTFSWSTAVSSNQVLSQRLGGHVRVYMKRPWYSSGDNELLGVVTLAASSGGTAAAARARRTARLPLTRRPLRRLSSAPLPDSLKPYVSQWGMDPLRLSADLDGPPAADRFPRAAPAFGGQTKSGLTLDEIAGVTVSAAGHAVKFDTSRKLWYSDIQINWGSSYFPFVRLALARFQPYSIPDAHLSRVVLADLVQLAPDRIATVLTNFDSSHPNAVQVTVNGDGYSDESEETGSVIEVTVEQQQADVAGDLAWVPVPNGTHALVTDSSISPKTWRGTFDLPRRPGTIPFRLLIKEYEQYPFNPGSGNTTSERRLVYAASVDV